MTFSIKIKLIFFIVLFMISGCSSWEPWVQPYEREILADPIMSFVREPSTENHFTHVYDVREGSRGAGSTVGGGCGCN